MPHFGQSPGLSLTTPSHIGAVILRGRRGFHVGIVAVVVIVPVRAVFPFVSAVFVSVMTFYRRRRERRVVFAVVRAGAFFRFGVGALCGRVP
jgi:hypothetical protein